MTIKVPFGHRMRDAHFSFSPSYTPLNHGSFGTHPKSVQGRQNELQSLAAARPDTFIVFDLPIFIDESRRAVAPLLGIDVDEVVFVLNATTGINTVLRNLRWEEGDVVVHFSTIYSACEKSISSVKDLVPMEAENVRLEYPIEDDEVIRRFKESVEKVTSDGKRVRLAMFDTVLTFPGVRMPWERLVEACKELGVLSLIDGAHGVGHIDLSELGKSSPDFFVSNCHKWLYTPRGCAVFYVPFRNQHLIRTSLPTSHGYQYPGQKPDTGGRTPFVHLFEFVATIDYSPYACVLAALEFRQKACGGEAEIRKYCFDLARTGGQRVAEILGTYVMNNKTKTMSQCCFANVALPLVLGRESQEREAEGQRSFSEAEAPRLQKWLNATAVKEFDTYLHISLHSGYMWVRLSGQIYLEMKDFEWVGWRLKELCARINSGEVIR
ncbi:aminotransferase family protein-like protein [Acephala macrosclerotiorum]|nr:aminotransferase family protein-like protein [Acephala macrosclerotiorum]